MNNNENVIEIRDIAKHYQVGDVLVKALASVSLDIKRGEYVAIMGPSGSGKSTLMNLIGCLDTPTRGQYILNGVDVSKMNDDRLAEVRNKEIGFIFQTFNLLARYSALENVALPLVYAGVEKEEREKRAKEALESVGLGDRMEHKPNEMSGGQRQRVAIARALVNKPSIMIADEPTGNLDSKTTVEVMSLLDAIHAQGNTVIVVTHEEDIALHAKRIVRLFDGEVASDRPNDKLPDGHKTKSLGKVEE